MHPVATDFGIKSTSECSDPPPGGDVGGGFLHDCLPFAVASTVTVAIATFNLISDWLAYRAILRLDIPAHARAVYNRTCAADTTSLDLHCNVQILPDVYFAFCVAASFAYFLSLVRYGAAFRKKRKNFIDRMDGVPVKRPMWDRHGDEVMLLSMLVVEDLPISCVLLALQIAINCDFYLPLGGAIFVVSVAGTCASVAWKLMRVAWKARHARRRAPRVLSGALLVASLAVVALNLTLLTSSGRHNVPERFLNIDKIAIDRWIDTENIVFAHMDNMRTEPSDGWSRQHDACRDFPRVAAVKDILHSPDTVVVRHLACEQKHMSFRAYFHQRHQRTGRRGGSCVVVFHFLYSTRHRTIFYNYGYRFVRPNNEGACWPPRTDESAENDVTGDAKNSTIPAAEDSPFVDRLTFCPIRHPRASNICGFDIVLNLTLLPISLCL